jgi:hypothetical protein
VLANKTITTLCFGMLSRRVVVRVGDDEFLRSSEANSGSSAPDLSAIITFYRSRAALCTCSYLCLAPLANHCAKWKFIAAAASALTKL